MEKRPLKTFEASWDHERVTGSGEFQVADSVSDKAPDNCWRLTKIFDMICACEDLRVTSGSYGKDRSQIQQFCRSR